MGILQKLFKKPAPKTQSMEFIQAKNFRGFKQSIITNYQFAEAQANIKQLKASYPKMDFSGCQIRLESITCSDGAPAVAVFVGGLRVGTVFFSNNNYSEFKKAFFDGKISAAHVGVSQLDDFYLYTKLEE